MTLPTQLVLRAFIEEPGRELYGLELCAIAGLASGTIHPILARLESIGWLESRWETLDPVEAGRPPRRYYQLNPDAADLVRENLAKHRASSEALSRLRPNVAPGNAK